MLNYLLLPVLFFVGLITSYEDIRYGKIKNKWIILGTSWALGVYIFLFTWNLTSHQPVWIAARPLLNGFVALAVAFLIWRVKKWSAGDAKLFFAFSLLLPHEYYQNFYIPIFPSVVLFINILIPLFLFLIFRSVFCFIKRSFI